MYNAGIIVSTIQGIIIAPHFLNAKQVGTDRYTLIEWSFKLAVWQAVLKFRKYADSGNRKLMNLWSIIEHDRENFRALFKSIIYRQFEKHNRSKGTMEHDRENFRALFKSIIYRQFEKHNRPKPS